MHESTHSSQNNNENGNYFFYIVCDLLNLSGWCKSIDEKEKKISIRLNIINSKTPVKIIITHVVVFFNT